MYIGMEAFIYQFPYNNASYDSISSWTGSIQSRRNDFPRQWCTLKNTSETIVPNGPAAPIFAPSRPYHESEAKKTRLLSSSRC